MATTARFTSATTPIAQGTDNTDRIRSNDYFTPAYASTITLALNKSYTLVAPAALTGAATITANVGTSTTAPYVGDMLDFNLQSDGTTRTVTFGTGFAPNGTLAVTTAKYATISFRFNGVAWVETGRAVSA